MGKEEVPEMKKKEKRNTSKEDQRLNEGRGSDFAEDRSDLP